MKEGGRMTRVLRKNRDCQGSAAGQRRVTLSGAGFLAACFVVLAGQPSARAGVVFYSGNLRTDAAILDCGPSCTLGPADSDADFAQFAAVVVNFTVSTAGPVQVITYGFGGGTSIGGHVVVAGGLEPYLSLFDSGGNFLSSTLLGTTCPVGAGFVGPDCFDVLLDAGVLAPDSYTLTLTAYENLSIAENVGGTLADGFTGLGNLAPTENLGYAFDLVVPDSAVPEPGSATLLCVALAAALAVRRRFAPALPLAPISRSKG
jgi:PEP-CTERM motif